MKISGLVVRGAEPSTRVRIVAKLTTESGIPAVGQALDRVLDASVGRGPFYSHRVIPGVQRTIGDHDLFRRACELDGVQLIVLLGEGTFHQIHGGVATSGRIGWEEMQAEYVALRGRPYAPPENERLYLGTVPESTLAHMEHSVAWALARRDRSAAL